MGRRRDLDGIRGIGMIGVLGLHGGTIPGGDFGLIAFFVLSGYLITTLLLRERDKTGRIDGLHFYVRRAARLLPALVLALGGFIAVSGRLGESLSSAIGNAVVALFYGMDVKVAYIAHASNPVSWAWSLSVEEQFYLVWPLILAVALWRNRVGVAAAIAVVGVVEPTIYRIVTAPKTSYVLLDPNGAHWTFRTYFGVDTRMDALFVGCLLAMALWKWPQLLNRAVAIVMGTAGLTIIGFAYADTNVFTRSTYTVWFSVATFASAGLIYGLLGAPRWIVSRFLAWRPISYLGQISYGVYLWNSTLGLYVGTLVSRHHQFERGTLWLTMTLAVAIASFHLIEQPILRRVSQRVTLAPPAEVAAVAAAHSHHPTALPKPRPESLQPVLAAPVPVPFAEETVEPFVRVRRRDVDR
ncbi:MAG TPA: acyltransferase [Mycobacteriales bacterium]|jgi:peptidoglycan/LPS O-acetylase OafA/YrhL|nr:acyltransferase [Mycobacteriales bacterium]